MKRNDFVVPLNGIDQHVPSLLFGLCVRAQMIRFVFLLWALSAIIILSLLTFVNGWDDIFENSRDIFDDVASKFQRDTRDDLEFRLDRGKEEWAPPSIVWPSS